MANYSFSRNERLYLQPETTFGIIPNTSGAATVSGSNCCRHVKATLKPDVAYLKRPDKTGTRTSTVAGAGRKTGSWSAEMSLVSNGAAGVVPDCDAILQAVFGQAASISAGVSCTYALTDAVQSFSMWSFRQPSTMMQRVGLGCIVKDATFNLGPDVAMVSFNGDALWVQDSSNFSASDTTGKGGLTAFPSEPSLPVTNGNIIAGFTGQATLDGTVLANIRSATLKIGTGNDINHDVFGSYYGDAPEGDERSIMTSFNIFDTDGASTQDLDAKAITKAGINIIYQIGTVAGSIWTFTLKNVQLSTPNRDDGQRRWTATFGDSEAHGSTPTALDEVALVLT